MTEVQSGPGIVFWILSVVILVSAFMVVSLRNIFHCALFLILCLAGVAGIYILLNAEFLAAAQVLIYVGAVSILIIFAVMLTSNLATQKILQTNDNAMVALVVCIGFVLGTVGLVGATHVWKFTDKPLPENNVLEIGKLLMTDYMVPFEVVSILLVAALMGAIMLAREEKS
jgi:NADH-quinone oxidoreductase subunit J